jgi:hypothetical protein
VEAADCRVLTSLTEGIKNAIVAVNLETAVDALEIP